MMKNAIEQSCAHPSSSFPRFGIEAIENEVESDDEQKKVSQPEETADRSVEEEDQTEKRPALQNANLRKNNFKEQTPQVI